MQTVNIVAFYVVSYSDFQWKDSVLNRYHRYQYEVTVEYVSPSTNSLSGNETFPGVPFCLPLCSSMDCIVDLGPAAYQECECGPDAIPLLQPV